MADHFDATQIHLAHRDVTFAVVSQVPQARIQRFQQRMGWRFPWVSVFSCDFQREYGVHFTKEELAGEVSYNYRQRHFGLEEAPGLSVFYKDESGEIFHTYSTYERGLDALLGTYQFLDLVPKERDEDGRPSQWLGYANTIGTPTIMSLIQKRTTRSRTKWARAAGHEDGV